MSKTNDTDEELMLLIQQGDQTAFESLYIKYAPLLISFANARIGSLDEAKDLIHDLFVHFWFQREEISIDVSVKAFLFAAVKYRIIDHIRKNSSRQKYREQLARLPLPIDAVEEKIYARDLEDKIDKAIAGLSPRVKEVFKLSRYEHLSSRQIAARLDVSEQTVKNQLSTALNFLRAKLRTLSMFFWFF